jgi:uncharacterized protein
MRHIGSNHRTGIKTVVLFLFFLLVTAIFSGWSQELPKPTGYVNDFAGVISQNDRNRMESIISLVEEKTGAEIAVVTVDTIAPYGSIEQYSVELAQTWGIGKEGEDNGILMLLAVSERQVRLEVGYGLEGAIPDGLAGEILDKSIIPAFRDGDYSRGFLQGVEAVAGIIAEEYDVQLGDYNLKEHSKYASGGGGPDIGYIVFVIIFMLVGGGRFFWPLLFLSGGYHRRGSFGGGFGSGGSFGNFSGFGGGGFGGGGASRGF